MSRNECNSCRYKAMTEDKEGHCYMFRTEPTLLCMQHPARASKVVIGPGNYQGNFGRYLVLTSVASLMVQHTKQLNGLK